MFIKNDAGTRLRPGSMTNVVEAADLSRPAPNKLVGARLTGVLARRP